MARRSLLPALSALRDDIARLRTEHVSWEDAVPAPKTLPSGELVEAWYLAGLFLRQWANSIGRSAWKQTMATGLQPGVSSNAQDRAQRQRPGDALAQDIAGDPSLDSLLAGHVELLAKSLVVAPPDTRHAGALVRATLETHEWCVTLAVLAEVQTASMLAGPRRALPVLRSSLRMLAGSVRELGFFLSNSQRSYAEELLTNYRNVTLAFSWMRYCQWAADSDIEDPLFPNGKEMAVIRELAENVSREFKGVEGLQPAAVRSVVERIAEAILQRGYREFAEDVASPGLFADHEWSGNYMPLNVIPGSEPGQCAPLLVAVAQAGKKTSLSKIIPKVRRHLIDCDPITKAVIIVTNEWKPGILGDSLDDLKSHVAKGKRIVFLLAPQPGNSIIHMPIALT
jgi:hypothetical protein